MSEKQSFGIKRFLNSLNGWQRIGVILSLGWFFCLSILVLTEPERSRPSPLEFFLIYAIPVFLLWVTPPALILVYRWVVEGFKKGD